MFVHLLTFVSFLSLFGTIDGRSASPNQSKRERSASVFASTSSKLSTCCNCFGPLKSQWNDAISSQMSEVYCRTCEDDNQPDDGEFVRVPKGRFDSPAILSNVTQRKCQRGADQPKIYTPTKRGDKQDKPETEDCELGDDVMSSDDVFNIQSDEKTHISTTIDIHDMVRVRGREELPVATELESVQPKCNNLPSQLTNEITDTNKSNADGQPTIASSKQISSKVVCTDDHPLIPRDEDVSGDCNGNRSASVDLLASDKKSILKRMHRKYSTLPKAKKTTIFQDSTHPLNRSPYSIPTKNTPDGTTIYYMCDLSKNVIKGAEQTHVIICIYSDVPLEQEKRTNLSTRIISALFLFLSFDFFKSMFFVYFHAFYAFYIFCSIFSI